MYPATLKSPPKEKPQISSDLTLSIDMFGSCFANKISEPNQAFPSNFDANSVIEALLAVSSLSLEGSLPDVGSVLAAVRMTTCSLDSCLS